MDEDQQSEWAAPGVARPSPLSPGLALIRSGIAAVRASSTVLGDEDCRDGVRDVEAVLAELESCWLGLVADLDTRPDAVPGARAGTVARSFLAAGLNRSHAQARRDVAAAEALHGRDDDAPLPLVGEAFSQGEITREHVDVAVRCLDRVPARAREAVEPVTGSTGLHRVDAYLAAQAKLFDPLALARLAKHLIAVLDPDTEGFDPERYLRRELSLAEAGDGMTLGKLQLDPANAVTLRAALAHFTHPERGIAPDQHQDQLPVTDERSLGQKQADALIEICRLAMDADPTATRREPAHVTIITTPEQLAEAHARPHAHPLLKAHTEGTEQAERAERAGEHGPAGCAEVAGIGTGGAAVLDPATLAVLTCDAILQTVILHPDTGAILNLGRDQRTATKAQRRALAARDKGCVVPGCPAPPERCDAHHLVYWSAGGPTDTTNLALVCQAHHTQIHLGIWQLTMINGVVHAQPPPWHHHANRGPIRNRIHDAIHESRKLAQQLRLDIDPPGDPPDAQAA